MPFRKRRPFTRHSLKIGQEHSAHLFPVLHRTPGIWRRQRIIIGIVESRSTLREHALRRIAVYAAKHKIGLVYFHQTQVALAKENQIVGTIRYWNSEKQFGFLVTEDGQESYVGAGPFTRQADFEGTRVRFDRQVKSLTMLGPRS
jgi:cold shock CspA family protein